MTARPTPSTSPAPGRGTVSEVPAGHRLFARYAYPPNELGYCGPADADVLLGHDASEIASHAGEFEGAWPYLEAICDAVGGRDPLDEDVVTNYWVGGPLLDLVDPGVLLARLRTAFTGQVTGLLTDVPTALANHGFQVFVVYPWVTFLDRDPTIPLRVLQDCRIRWGTVDAVDDDHAVVVSRPLVFEDGDLGLGEAAPERIRWRREAASLAPAPAVGGTVSAHWDWVCGPLSDADREALERATAVSLDLVNETRRRSR